MSGLGLGMESTPEYESALIRRKKFSEVSEVIKEANGSGWSNDCCHSMLSNCAYNYSTVMRESHSCSCDAHNTVTHEVTESLLTCFSTLGYICYNHVFWDCHTTLYRRPPQFSDAKTKHQNCLSPQ